LKNALEEQNIVGPMTKYVMDVNQLRSVYENIIYMADSSLRLSRGNGSSA